MSLVLIAAWAALPALAIEPTATASAPQVLAQYVLMAHSDLLDRTVPLARVILAQPAAACPSISTSDGKTLEMTWRLNPNPAAFGVAVCEAVLPDGAGVTAKVMGQSTPLPRPPEAPGAISTLVVVGDSGCKGGTKQPCSAEGSVLSAWPFPQITAAAAQDSPDLVIHVGDYNYRGTPNKTGAGQWSYDGCVPADGGPLVHQSTYDTWTTWDEDFFTPAKPLLAAAPWVVTRGNHELCSRAGRGWFYFLDPHSPLLNPWVEARSCDSPSAPTEPYRLSFSNLDLLMMDTANACGGEDPESPAGIAYEVGQYMRQLNTVNALAPREESRGSGTAWLVGHRPLWSLQQYPPDPPVSENQTMQPALKATPLGALAPSIKMLLSGHMHQFFSLTFQQGSRPPQLVVGNSGVELSGNALGSPWTGTVDGVPASGLSSASGASFGYLLAKVKDGGHWVGTVKRFSGDGQPQSDALATCALPIQKGDLCKEP